MKSKIEIIETLKAKELFELLKALLKKIGYSKIENKGDILLAETGNALSLDLHGFIVFQEKLSGNIDYNSIKTKVNDLKIEYNFHTTFIVSQNHISKGFETEVLNLIENINLKFLGRDSIIELIEKHQKEYWIHDDLELLEFEKNYFNTILKESQLKKLKIFDDKYKKLLDIFIEPRIFHFHEEPETKTPMRKRISLDQVAESKTPFIISGGSGSGKSTTLKKLGEILITKNAEKAKRNIPIFLNVTEIFDNNYAIKKVVNIKLSEYFGKIDDTFFTQYNISILIDTIDELEDENQKIIIKELNHLHKELHINYVIGTRNFDKVLKYSGIDGNNTFHIEKFNSEQIKKFISMFFHGELGRAEELLDALKENRILEKLPITPLSLSLISILYEENNLEIPATITDIYDNFNSLLLGKASVSSRVEFIDISFKERILSLYALELLERKEHTPMTRNDFHSYFQEYFKSKTIPIKKGTLEDVLNHLIDSTGILILKNNKYVQFSHISFMEYYAALEIFKHQRAKEKLFVNNFFENNWQNSAVFYAGKSKDMPEFLNKIINKLKDAKFINDFFMGVIGTGYLLQALYQTDNKIRKEAIMQALDLNIQSNEIFMKLAADDSVLFRNYKLPILWLMNVLYFFESFNSITLKEALKLTFKELFEDYKGDKQNTIAGYKAFKIALTLSSKRIHEKEELGRLIMETDLTNDSVLCTLAEFSLDIFKGDEYKELKKEIRKQFEKMSPAMKQLTEIPASRLRFSSVDQIRLSKKVKIVTEGKTDSEILEHAYITLTKGAYPYWQISPAGNESGGAHELFKLLMCAKPIIESDKFLFGIFDHDSTGIQNFRGLKDEIFKSTINNTLKKHSYSNIYAICIPIPGEMSHYIKKDQIFNFFELEHYFDENLLREHDMLETTEIDGISKIKESKKKAFSKFIRQQTDPILFKNFIELFKLIDSQTGVDFDYDLH